jgi:hypothetical protein
MKFQVIGTENGNFKFDKKNGGGYKMLNDIKAGNIKPIYFLMTSPTT